MPRPCPFVGCRYHLFLDVNAWGGVSFPYGEDVIALQGMADTCALDRADRGRTRMNKISAIFRMTGARARMLVQSALAKLGIDNAMVEMRTSGRKPAFAAEKYVTNYGAPVPHHEVVRRRHAARIFAEDTWGS